MIGSMILKVGPCVSKRLNVIASNYSIDIFVPQTAVNRFELVAQVENYLTPMQSQLTIAGSSASLIAFSFDSSRVWLELTTRQTQFIRLAILINGTNVSDYAVGDLQISWPDEAGGSGSLRLREQNPFGVSPVFGIDSLIHITASITDPATGTESSLVVFTGRVVQFDYQPDDDLTELSFQDMSRDVSHTTDKLNREILGVDPIYAEKITATTNNAITVSRDMDGATAQALLGIWLESDISRKTNFADKGDYILEGRTISFFASGLITAGNNYVVQYIIPTDQFEKPTLKKSQVIEIIAGFAGITSVKLERKNLPEDEVVGVNISANDEYPLDIMRKICVPQTWKVEYNETGDLVVRREILKATEDFTLDENIILEDSLKFTKATDNVVNDQMVVGIVKQLGQTGGIV